MAGSSAQQNQKHLGAILAGGQSKRFGSDKAEAMLRGRRIIDHAIDSLSRHVHSLVVVGKDVPGLTCIVDRPKPHLGPLGGLNAALHHACAHGFSGVLSLGCDMPVLPDEAAVSLFGDRPAILDGHHLVGYWPASLAELLDEHLKKISDRSIRGWMTKIEPLRVYLAGPPLPNINTPSDLELVRQTWARF